MSDTSSVKARSTKPSMTGHPAFSRRTPSKTNTHARLAPLSMGAKALTSDSSSIITNSTIMRHLNVKSYYENTFKTKPDEEKRFTASSSLRDTIQEIMEDKLSNAVYDNERCSTLSQDLSRMIKQKVQQMDFERYKLLVTVMIGENTGQGLQMASRFLWNTHTDNFVTAEYKNGTLFAVASVYAVYFD